MVGNVAVEPDGILPELDDGSDGDRSGFFAAVELLQGLLVMTVDVPSLDCVLPVVAGLVAALFVVFVLVVLISCESGAMSNPRLSNSLPTEMRWRIRAFSIRLRKTSK